jgi:hypothetical protein
MTKRNKIIYWVATIWLSLGMVATGLVQLLRVRQEGQLSPPGVYGIVHLGMPVYILTVLGIWKILGIVVLLAPRLALVKEWAYAGFFFLMSGAVFAHVAVGDPVKELWPSVLLIGLLVVSWVYRPAGRRLVFVNQ